MNGSITRDYNFTVRLSLEEKVHLEQLARHLDLNKSATVCRALRIALRSQKALNSSGIFTPANALDVRFPVRLANSWRCG